MTTDIDMKAYGISAFKRHMTELHKIFVHNDKCIGPSRNFCWHCNILCTSGVLDDVMFSYITFCSVSCV